MRVFTTMCKDSVTGMEMLLSECSYNSACYWLASKGFKDYDKFECSGDRVSITFTKPSNRTFVYDEERGYLLGN